MKRIVVLGAAVVGLGAGQASAYEFPLRFTPIPGNLSHLVVAGYKFVKGQVVGNCSFDITTSGSGRDPRSFTTHYYYTCTWDAFGNNVLQATGAPTTPTP